MVDKIKFRSKFERTVYDRAKRKQRELEYEPSRPHIIYTNTSRYKPDFILPNGILIECKGYFKPSDRTKMRRVKQDNPELDIRFVFQRAKNRLTKSVNSMTYSAWAERHGFSWADEVIPEEWWEEK